MTSGVKLADNADKEVIDVAYTAVCMDSPPQPGVQECAGMRLGDQVKFNLDVTLKNTSCDGEKRMYR